LIMVVVAVAVTVATAGATATALGATATTAAGTAAGTATLGSAALTGGAFASGVTLGAAGGSFAATSLSATFAISAAVGAAAGSIASQVVGLAIGAQDRFSWRQVGLSALGAAVTSGLGSAGVGGKAFNTALGSNYVAAAASAAIRSTVTQGLGSALGMQSFNWKAVAVSAIAAPLTTAVGELADTALSGWDTALRDGIKGTLSAALTQRVRMQVYNNGKLDWSSFAADAFGNAIGNSVVAEMQESARWNSIKQEEEIARQADNPTGQVDRIANRGSAPNLNPAAPSGLDPTAAPNQVTPSRGSLVTIQPETQWLLGASSVAELRDRGTELFSLGSSNEYKTRSAMYFPEQDQPLAIEVAGGTNGQPPLPAAQEWERAVGPVVREQVIAAICKCRDQSSVADVLGALAESYRDMLFGKDMLADRPSDLNETHRKQQCFAEQFVQGGVLNWNRSRPLDPSLLVEVPYARDPLTGRYEMVPSTGRTTYDGGPVAPASLGRALNLASQLGRYQVTILDLVNVIDPTQPATIANSKAILEIKFGNDTRTDNQSLAFESPSFAGKIHEVRERDYTSECDLRDNVARESSARSVDQFIRSLSDSLLSNPPLPPGPRLPTPRPAVPQPAPPPRTR
jgi:hypothetical protein